MNQDSEKFKSYTSKNNLVTNEYDKRDLTSLIASSLNSFSNNNNLEENGFLNGVHFINISSDSISIYDIIMPFYSSHVKRRRKNLNLNLK